MHTTIHATGSQDQNQNLTFNFTITTPFTNSLCQQKNPLPLEEVAPREGLYVVWYTLLLLMQAFVAI